MFWRLFFTYLALVITAVGLVGLIILQRDRVLFFDLAESVGLAVTAVMGAAVVVALFFARRFARPFKELTAGAARIAEGDLGHKIHVSGTRELSWQYCVAAIVWFVGTEGAATGEGTR